MAAAASGHMLRPVGQGVWQRGSVLGRPGALSCLSGCGEPPHQPAFIMMARAFSWRGCIATNLAGWSVQNLPGLPFVLKDNLNVTQVGLARDPATHYFRGHRPENAGAQRRR